MRWSGGDRINLQNLPRKSELRSAIVAPPGHVLSIVDASQIECRILNTFAGQWDVVEAFENKVDQYCRLATAMYGYEVTSKKTHPGEREVGKFGELSCGYQVGDAKLERMARNKGLKLEPGQALQIVTTYRATHPAVVALWKTAGRMISAIGGTTVPVEWSFLTVTTGRITFPTGQSLKYDDLQFDPGTGNFGEWTYRSRSGRVKLYGGKLVENLIQWLARMATAEAMVRVKKAGIKIATMSHDETVCVVPVSEAEAQHAFVIEQMRKRLDWLPACPLEAEGVLSERYTK